MDLYDIFRNCSIKYTITGSGGNYTVKSSDGTSRSCSCRDVSWCATIKNGMPVPIYKNKDTWRMSASSIVSDFTSSAANFAIDKAVSVQKTRQIH